MSSTFVRKGLGTTERRFLEITEDALGAEIREHTEYVALGKCSDIAEYCTRTGKILGLRKALEVIADIKKQFEEE